MKRFTLVLSFCLFAICVANILGQSNAGKAKAQFTLQIHTAQDTYKSGDGILVLVDLANISQQNFNECREVGDAWFNMDVRGESGPAEQTEKLKRILHPPPPNPDDISSMTGSEICDSLEPGKAGQEEVPVSMYFRMKKPGKYSITFSKGTNPGQPNNIVVKSNTITITVVAPEPADAPQ
jgi:hypothetical protein